MEEKMPYVKPDAVVENMVQAGANKAKLPVRDLLFRGFLSGALLGFATTLAFTASAQTRLGIVGALIFPVGFVMIVLLGLELVTGNFALVPLAVREKKVSLGELLSNWGWVFVGNLIGGMFYALLFTLTLPPDSEMARQIMGVAEARRWDMPSWDFTVPPWLSARQSSVTGWSRWVSSWP